MSSIVIYTDYSLAEFANCCRKKEERRNANFHDSVFPLKSCALSKQKFGNTLYICIYMNEYVDLNACNVYICIYMHIYIHLIYIYTHIYRNVCMRLYSRLFF